LLGFFSGPNYGKMRDRFLRDQFRPEVQRVVDAYNLHQIDYGTAIAQLEQLRQQGVDRLRQLKGDGHRAHQVVDEAISKINQTEAARQTALQNIAGLPIPEFAGGGIVTGALGQPVPVLAHGGEVILNRVQQAMVGPQRIREAFQQSGASEQPRGGSFAAGGMVGGGDTFIIHAVDAKSFEELLARNPRALSGAIRKLARGAGKDIPF
jgi:hypothetical protein